MRTVQPTGAQVRMANVAAVVDVVRRTGIATRAQLVERTRLSRATVSSVVGELLARGVVVERPIHEVPEGGHGRPPQGLVLDRSAGIAVAVDIGVRHLAVSVSGLSRRPLAERWLPIDGRLGTGASIALASIAEVLRDAEVDFAHVIGAAVSVATAVPLGDDHPATGNVFPGWDVGDLVARMKADWGVPVFVENDANLGALAASQESEDPQGTTLYVKYATRIGLGIAIDGKIYRGGHGSAGELGHLQIVPDGERCWCGRRGCLELTAGGAGIAQTLGIPSGHGEIAEIITRALAGDGATVAAVADAARKLGSALASAALVLDPSHIVIGGELARLGDLVLGPVNQQLGSVQFGCEHLATLSPLGNRASLVGAIALVLSVDAGSRPGGSRSTTHTQPAH